MNLSQCHSYLMNSHVPEVLTYTECNPQPLQLLHGRLKHSKVVSGRMLLHSSLMVTISLSPCGCGVVSKSCLGIRVKTACLFSSHYLECLPQVLPFYVLLSLLCITLYGVRLVPFKIQVHTHGMCKIGENIRTKHLVNIIYNFLYITSFIF